MGRYQKYFDAAWRWAGLCLLCYVLNACHKSLIEPMPHDEEVTFTFSVKLPGVSKDIKTYALTGSDENFLEDVDVLVFTNDGSGMKFEYRSVGQIIEQSTGVGVQAEIKVRLWRTDVDTRLVILANVRRQVNEYDFDVGATTPNDIQTGMVYALDPGEEWLANDGDFTPLPMWADYDIDGGIDGDLTIGASEITLARSLACVDVVNQATDDFELTEVWVFNSKANGLIIPNSGNPEEASLPDPLVLITNSSPLTYAVNFQTVPSIVNELVSEIYLFEADAAEEDDDPAATALVIGGKFGSGPPDPSKTCYYRIDFRDENGNLMPLLRNHRYVITIVGAVYDDGRSHYNLPEDAFDAPSLPLFSYSDMGSFRGSKTVDRTPFPQHTDIIPKGLTGLQYAITAIAEN